MWNFNEEHTSYLSILAGGYCEKAFSPECAQFCLLINLFAYSCSLLPIASSKNRHSAESLPLLLRSLMYGVWAFNDFHSLGMSTVWSDFLVNAQTSTEISPPLSPRVRTFVLAGPQKNADKADIIFGLLQGPCVHVCMCRCTYVCGYMREHMHGKIRWRRPWFFRCLLHCEIGAEITKLWLERVQSLHPPCIDKKWLWR